MHHANGPLTIKVILGSAGNCIAVTAQNGHGRGMWSTAVSAICHVNSLSHSVIARTIRAILGSHGNCNCESFVQIQIQKQNFFFSNSVLCHCSCVCVCFFSVAVSFPRLNWSHSGSQPIRGHAVTWRCHNAKQLTAFGYDQWNQLREGEQKQSHVNQRAGIFTSAAKMHYKNWHIFWHSKNRSWKMVRFHLSLI